MKWILLSTLVFISTIFFCCQTGEKTSFVISNKTGEMVTHGEIDINGYQRQFSGIPPGNKIVLNIPIDSLPLNNYELLIIASVFVKGKKIQLAKWNTLT